MSLPKMSSSVGLLATNKKKARKICLSYPRNLEVIYASVKHSGDICWPWGAEYTDKIHMQQFLKSYSCAWSCSPSPPGEGEACWWAQTLGAAWPRWSRAGKNTSRCAKRVTHRWLRQPEGGGAVSPIPWGLCATPNYYITNHKQLYSSEDWQTSN